ncbi:MAG: tRNA (adenosine(37)-N6)-dimethylallyltransferase MiaA [Candidatus Korobacteraceae bacterium]
MPLTGLAGGSAPSPEPLLLVILGPTGSGKTELSLAMATRFGGEIVNCDSVAVYREFVIGVAKPAPEQRARVPHHLFDILDPGEHMTAGEYARRAREVLGEVRQRGTLPIVTGGTGLYLRALLEGLFPGPQRSEQMRGRLRQRQQQRGSAYLHRLLHRLDAAAAASIHANDAPKLIRAIEVCLGARQPMTRLWESGRDPLRGFRVLKIGLDPPRSLLYEKLNARAVRMFDEGLIEETADLMRRYPQAWALSSLGYRQAAQYIRGELSREQAIAAVQQSHRNYAKRQMTWFRREPDVSWLAGFGGDPQIQSAAASLVQDALYPQNARAHDS